ncbi:MAG: L-lysine 6-transaminase [Candidatus Latescibacteria bacterium]|nr:L-lysine 6-transaminase [bacterium]MBD3425332.1 L-lysine 6-transaminase [Candidatus Latescibacterota bacterium]
MSEKTYQSGVTIKPADVHKTLGNYMLVDGYPIVLDLEKSRGSWVYDSLNEKKYLDFFTFFASNPIGHNHPGLLEKDFYDKMARVAVNKPSNSDLYTTQMAEFVETFHRIAVPEGFNNLFFVSGGALAVENALKAAFDWKVRKNMEKGVKGEKGHKVIHFREAFHGRTGYTMSLTNTDPTKIKHFPKFDWPRIENPKVTFPIEDNLADIEAAEKRAVEAIEKVITEDGENIAAIIIEPIQGEGGDNHFRKEFFQELRRIADDNEVILIYDEVQTGVGITGKMWAWQNFGVAPDILAFGKKTQVCGIMATDRVNDVDSVFKVSGRINSTWGGNLLDMYRAKRIFEIIEQDNLVQNAADKGKILQDALRKIQSEHPDIISNARGMGLFCAFDLKDDQTRDKLVGKLFENGLFILKCGCHTIRFRPPLNVSEEEIEQCVEIISDTLKDM